MKKLKIDKITNKNIDELISENNELVEYINNCLYKNEKGEVYIKRENYDSEKFDDSIKRYEQIHEIIQFDESQSKMKYAEEMRAEITKNKDLIFKANDNKCFICGLDMIEILIIHHIKPITDGGTNNLDNLAVLCPNCHSTVHKAIKNVDNYSKGNFFNKLEEYFVKSELMKIITISHKGKY